MCIPKIIFLFYLVSIFNQAEVKSKEIPSFEARAREKDINEFPSIVQIREKLWSNNARPSKLCTGNLISLNRVLTTAKCVFRSKRIVVVAGTTNFSPKVPTITVDDVVVHPKYKFGGYGYNLAVLLLSENLTESDKIKPIEIGACNTCENCKWAGWGNFFYNTNINERKVSTTFLLGYTGDQRKHIDCENELENIMTYKRKFMTCRQDTVYDGTCTQEEGLGLQCDNKLVGISIQSKCSTEASTLFVFYNIFRHRNWILNISNDTIETRSIEHHPRYKCKNSAFKNKLCIGTIYFVGIYYMLLLQYISRALYK